MAWNLDSDRPVYAQIIEEMQLRIIMGQYPLGTKIPSVRELAAEAGVNPNTMQKALSELERSGLVTAQRTSGRIVTEDKKMVKDIRNKIAQEQMRDFVDKMRKLGFDKEEIIKLLEQAERGAE